MKHLKVLFALSFILCGSMTHADYACDPCDPCYQTTDSDCCKFTVYVDALYFHLCSGSLTRDVSNGEDRELALDPGYDWGWRLGGNFHKNNWDLGFRYTGYSSKTNEDFNPGHSDDQTFFNFNYRVFDLELGRSCCVCDGLVLKPFAGGKFAIINTAGKRLQFDDHQFLMQHEGNGLYLGLASRWELCRFNSCGYDVPLAFVSRLSTAVLHSDFTIGGDDTGFEGDFDKQCLFTPVHEVYLGLELGFDGLCDSEGFFQIGYEAQYWGWRDYDSADDITHLGLGGMVLRFGTRF